MIIVITDGYTLNPGDLSWDDFKNIAEVKYYERTPFDEVTERCREATVIITNKTPVTAETIQSALKLKLIAVTATGYNVVDIAAAKQKGIIVCNVPEYGTNSVAQHTIALLLELTNHAGKHAQSVQEGEWQKSIDWCYTKAPIMELSGKTIGIVGFGRIGQKVAVIAKALGMRVIFYNPNKQSYMAASVSLMELFM
ncbi:MAG: NAD(P)-dependent oxidoreductase, partial [Ginsengibacter sp.]